MTIQTSDSQQVMLKQVPKGHLEKIDFALLNLLLKDG